MKSTPLREVNDVLVTRTRSRVNPNDQGITGKKMVYSEKNESHGKQKAAETAIADEKENSSQTVRRSKRGITTSTSLENVPKTSKPTKNTKAKKPASKKAKSASKSKKGHPAKDLNQTKLDFPVIEEVPEVSDKISEDVNKPETSLTTSICSAVTEDSGFCNLPTHKNNPERFSIAVFNSPDVRSTVVTPCASENSILTTDTPPTSYWKVLAEQRQQALESALYENEMLHDELEVLEAENQQLKQLLKEAGDFAQAMKGVLAD